MPIDPAFLQNHQVIGKHKNEDGRFHFVWGPGRSNVESALNDQVQESYKTRGEEYVPLGVHGTFVAVDWDSCIPMEPVQRHVLYKYSIGTEVSVI